MTPPRASQSQEYAVRAMLVALTESENESTASKAREIVTSEDFDFDSSLALVTCGGFLAKVLVGDFLGAWTVADYANRRALFAMLARSIVGNSSGFPQEVK